VGTVDFSPTGTYNLTAGSNQDVVVLKLTQGTTQAVMMDSASQVGDDIAWLDAKAVRKPKSTVFADWLAVEN
jgi:hypothetical protein